VIEWHFEEKVYRRWVVLMIGSWEELVEEMRAAKYIYVDDMERAAGMNIRLDLENSDHTCTVIWMPKFSLSVLAHELVHLVMATFNRASVPIAYDNEEAFAFYMEYWFREISRVYRRFPKGRTSHQARKGG